MQCVSLVVYLYLYMLTKGPSGISSLSLYCKQCATTIYAGSVDTRLYAWFEGVYSTCKVWKYGMYICVSLRTCLVSVRSVVLMRDWIEEVQRCAVKWRRIYPRAIYIYTLPTYVRCLQIYLIYCSYSLLLHLTLDASIKYYMPKISQIFTKLYQQFVKNAYNEQWYSISYNMSTVL